MIYEVIVTDQADADLRGIYEYTVFELLSPDNAARQLGRLEEHMVGPEEFPEKFRHYEKEPWTKSVFYNYVKEKELEQAAHGVSVSPDAWGDGMYLLHLRCSQGIFSHETALFFHDLTDREPSPYSITVKRGYSTTRLKADGVLVYTIKPELHGIGKSTAQTPFGHTVPAYDMERIICDLLRWHSADTPCHCHSGRDSHTRSKYRFFGSQTSHTRCRRRCGGG